MADRRRMSLGRTGLVAGATALTSLIALTGTGFACSGVMGNLVLTPSSGPAGSIVKTSASGLKPYPAKYELFFGGTCMTFTGKWLKTITTDTTGGWTNKKVTIPSSTAPGSYALCGIEAYPVSGQTATTHDAFTVV